MIQFLEYEEYELLSSSDLGLLGLIRVALLLYSPPTCHLGPLPDPYPIPRGYLIHTDPKIK